MRFHLHPLRRTDEIELTCEAPLLEYREVKDSGGKVENRPFIRTRCLLGDHAWDIEISLSNRETMKFRMLLGREAVAGHFIINPSESFLSGPSLAKSYGY